jgi:hypothetical protein
VTDKMEPVAYTDRTELKAVKDGNGLMWPGPIPTLSEPDGETALYTADQVKELTDRARNDALEEAATEIDCGCPERAEVLVNSVGFHAKGCIHGNCAAMDALAIRALKDQPHD